MPKKFKRTTYEKDNDDHYVVVLNPWTKGCAQRSQAQINWIGAWLRIAFRKPSEKNIVKNIYTVETRSEIIARISSSVDVETGLGLHRWGEFMERRDLLKIKRQTGVDLSENISYIFLYNWTLHGDPAERQWQEWFPLQDDLPPDVMIKWQYPEPEWTEIPVLDARLRSFIIAMPRIPGLNFDRLLDQRQDGAVTTRESKTPLFEDSPKTQLHKEDMKPKLNDKQEDMGQTNSGKDSRSTDSATAFSPYESPVHLQSQLDLPLPNQPTSNDKPVAKSSKIDKFDPYEEARANLNTSSNGVKSEAEDVKPDLEYRPSNALLSAVYQLQNGAESPELEDRKPVIKEEGPSRLVTTSDLRAVKAEEPDIKPDLQDIAYRPSAALARAFSNLHNGPDSPDQEDQKLIVKTEEYTPSPALINAFAQYSEISSPDTDDNRAPKRNLRDGRVAGDESANTDSSGPRGAKRIKTERNTAY